MGIRGIDYAFSPHPSPAQMKAAGVHFAGRYISSNPVNDTNGKNLLAPEKQALLAAGISIVLFAEEGASRMLQGHSAGVTDAAHFDAVVKALGMPGAVMYCCADFDASPQQQAPINAYLDGAASVIGHGRTGIYGSFYVVGRALDAQKAAYSCQTVAWSGGQWEPRANINQHLQINVGGISVDLDQALTPDYGQWPRPTPPVQPPPQPVKLQADGVHSYRQLVHAHATSIPRGLWLMARDPGNDGGNFGTRQRAYIALNDFDKIPPKGMYYWVG